MSGRTLGPVERMVGWIVGVPFATWRYASREVEIQRHDSACDWPPSGFAQEPRELAGGTAPLQPAAAGRGAAFRRLYRVRVERPVLTADELMSIVLNDPNVACPLEIARFERDESRSAPLEVGEELRVRLPGPWNGPVRVVETSERSFRLATLRGHMEAGEIEFRARDDDAGLLFEIESWARSSGRVFDFLYDRLGVGRELQLDMWAFFLERVAQISGGVATHGIEAHTERCARHPL